MTYNFTNCATLDDMCNALGAFYKREGLEQACALEALMGMELTPAQSAYLCAFVDQWDALQDADDA
jgi:hypothetical protein